MNAKPGDQPATGVGFSLWERIQRDPGFVAAKRRIQKRYGLPLPFDIRHHYRRWQTWLGRAGKRNGARKKRGESFLSEVQTLLKYHQVPDAWYPDFIADIAGRASNQVGEIKLPRTSFYQDAQGEWKWECILTPETNLTDPFVLEAIQNLQKEYAGDPPAPVPDLNDRRKLDWQPVLQWHRQHPLFSIAEIAGRIGYAPATLRRKFRKIERGKPGRT
jgi:hypothetical protein